MHRSKRHHKKHIAWLPAAVLGADDGIVSTASLILGVTAAHGTHANILIAGIAGLVAGAMSMAASEYVSVYSLEDYEQADLQRKRACIKADSDGTHAALVASYLGLGLDAALAKQVADQLMSNGAMGAYARNELLISPARRARPNQAAFTSAGSFALGASMPVLIVLLAPRAGLIACVSAVSLISLALLGAWAARTGGASVIAGAMRVAFWGALAMVLTAAVGTLFGTVA